MYGDILLVSRNMSHPFISGTSVPPAQYNCTSHSLPRIVYLDRLTKELLAYLQQLKGTNQLGTYFCDIAAACYDLEQSVEYFVDKFAGLSLLEVVNTEVTVFNFGLLKLTNILPFKVNFSFNSNVRGSKISEKTSNELVYCNCIHL